MASVDERVHVIGYDPIDIEVTKHRDTAKLTIGGSEVAIDDIEIKDLRKALKRALRALQANERPSS